MSGPDDDLRQSDPLQEEQLQPEPEPEIEEAAAPGPTMSHAPRQSMPYYTPLPTAAEEAAPRPRSTLRWPLLVTSAIVAVGVGLGSWYALQPAEESTSATSTISRTVDEKVLRVSESDMDLKATAHLKDLLSQDLSPSELASALDQAVDQGNVLKEDEAEALKMLTGESEEICEDLRSDKRALYRIHLLDFLEEDGDEVVLFVDDVCYGPVALSQTGMDVLIPLAQGKSSRMRIVATRDGGGGVTFGLVSSLGEVGTRVMQIGEFEEWWVTVK